MTFTRSTKYHGPLAALASRLADHPPHEMYGHHRQVANKVEGMRAGLEALEKLAWARDPTATDAAHAQKVAAAAAKLEAHATSAERLMQETITAGVRSLSDRVDARAGLTPDGYAAEIRQTVRAMTADQRREVLAQAIDAGDAQTVAALATGPAILTGLNEDYRTKMADHYRAVHAPDEFAAMTSLVEMLGTTLTAASITKAAAQAATNPAYLKDIAARQATANEASANFQAAIDG